MFFIPETEWAGRREGGRAGGRRGAVVGLRVGGVSAFYGNEEQEPQGYGTGGSIDYASHFRQGEDTLFNLIFTFFHCGSFRPLAPVALVYAVTYYRSTDLESGGTACFCSARKTHFPHLRRTSSTIEAISIIGVHAPLFSVRSLDLNLAAKDLSK